MATASTQAVKFVKQRAVQRFVHWHNRVETVIVAGITDKFKKTYWFQFRKRSALKRELFGAIMIQSTIKGAINEIELLR